MYALYNPKYNSILVYGIKLKEKHPMLITARLIQK